MSIALAMQRNERQTREQCDGRMFCEGRRADDSRTEGQEWISRQRQKQALEPRGAARNLPMLERWRMRYVVFRGLTLDDGFCVWSVVPASLQQLDHKVPLWWLGGGGDTSSVKLRERTEVAFSRSPLQNTNGQIG